ncbi:MAG: energy-coupling factor transporter transmembrane protein EcfT [Collinsella sp.]|nr:energy-coupling factor transporter transmembrane protein EcfT [Collinsella sp.]
MALRVSIGQYHSADSPIHRLDPRVKLAATVVFMASCFFIQSPATLMLGTAVVVAAVASAHVPLGRLFSQIRPIAIFLILTSVMNLFFVQTGEIALVLGPIRIFWGGAEAAILYTIRFLLLLIAGSLLMLTTTPTSLTDALGWLLAPLERIGVPVAEGTLVLSIALRFVPTLAREADNIVAANIARGASFEGKGPVQRARAFIPLVVPLFASAIRHADNLGRAMDARCYTGEGRTHYHELAFDIRRDGPFVAAAVAHIVLLTALRIAGI